MDGAARLLPAPLLTLAAHALFWPTLAWNFLLVKYSQELHWYDEIVAEKDGRGRVILGGYPWPAWVALDLEISEKVEVAINTVAEKPGSMFSKEVKMINLPMRDFAEPSARAVLLCVAEIDAAFQSGQTVYVHCKAGKGRSATAVLCWLVIRKGLSVAEAQALLIAKRPQVLGSLASRKVVLDIVGGR
jgi:atypical dual specificity phosphatase